MLGEVNPPSHTAILAFTRGLAGPIDYTPGIFVTQFKSERKKQYVCNTLVNQLALYVVLYSPLQMVANLPENYKNHPAFNFIKTVATNWDKTNVINGEIGEFITIARKEKMKNNWFVGSITNKEKRTLNLSLNFLKPSKEYQATIYEDDENLGWKQNPTSYKIKKLM